MSFKKNLFQNLLVSGGYTYLSTAFNFIASTIVSRILDPSNYGLVGLITVFTGFIAVFSEGGISYALIRSDYGLTFQRVLTNISWFLGIILFFITVLIAYPISIFYHNSTLIIPTLVLGSTFIIRSLSLAQGAVLAKQLNFAYIGKVTLITTVISVTVTIILAYLNFGYWSLITPQIIISALTAFLYERKVKLGFKLFRASYIVFVFKKTKKLVGTIIGFNSVNYWSRNVDNMVVGKWYGATDLGIYNRAYSLLVLPLTLITGIFTNILFPSLKKLQSEGGDIEKEYYFVLRVITFCSFPLVILFILLPTQLVHFLWGDKWLLVGELLPYFGLLIFTQTLLSTLGQLLILMGKENVFMLGGWVTAVFLVTAILLGAKISLVAIAQFYSFSFIFFVLLFHVIYIYIHILKFNKKMVLIFWLPKIAISLAIWISLYIHKKPLTVICLLILTSYLIIDNRKQLKKITQLFVDKIGRK